MGTVCFGFSLSSRSHDHGVVLDVKRVMELFALSTAQGNAWAYEHRTIWVLSFYYGHGVATDKKRAVGLYMLSAEQVNSGGQCHLGYCLLKGLGVAQDKKRAMELFTLLAEQGCTEMDQSEVKTKLKQYQAILLEFIKRCLQI